MKEVLVFLGVASPFYFITAMQVRMGFPQFYKRWNASFFSFKMPNKAEATEAACDGFIVIIGIGTGSVLSEITGIQAFLFVTVATFYYVGWSVRIRIKREAKRPIEDGILYRFFPALSKLTHRWPMLPFDLWTMGISGSIGAMAAQSFG